jgi:NitT/TauT family transport system permease protein
MKRVNWRVLAGQLIFTVLVLLIWQWGFALKKSYGVPMPELLDPYFISTPSEIWSRLLRISCVTDRSGNLLVLSGGFADCLERTENHLWIATAVTLKNTFWGFFVGVLTGFVTGLVLGRSAFWGEVFQPFIIALNSIPRIAVVPLIILMFGIGDASKIVTAWVLVFFLVFFNTFEGTRQVDRDLVSVARLLHAREWQVMVKVIIPSTLSWVFASLSPAIAFSLIGVIVAEFVGTERGLGRLIMEAEGRGEASVMMGAIFVLMVVGTALSFAVRGLQRYLLRWQLQDAG